MIRVVIDTNVLVSALLQPEGLPAAVWMLAFSGRIEPCLSEDILTEYEEVISRSHFRCDTEIVAATIRAIRKIGRYVKPTKHADGCSDPDDNMFLECAEAAHADFIVTGNQRHFPAEWKKTRVIGVRELIEILIQQED